MLQLKTTNIRSLWVSTGDIKYRGYYSTSTWFYVEIYPDYQSTFRGKVILYIVRWFHLEHILRAYHLKTKTKTIIARLLKNLAENTPTLRR